MILKWGEVIIFYENIHHPCFFKLFAPFLVSFLTKNVCFQDTVGTDKEHQLDFQETGNLLFPHIWHIFCTFCQYEIIFGQMINISIRSCKIEFKMGNKYFPSFSCFCFHLKFYFMKELVWLLWDRERTKGYSHTLDFASFPAW